jgi:hypothetical protein
MARYTGTYDAVHTVAAEPGTVRDVFLDLGAVEQHYGDLESCEEVAPGTLRFLLTAQNHGVFTFQGRYACHYEADGEQGVKWRSVDAQPGDNVETAGHLTVAPGDAPGTTRLHYVAEMTLDIEVAAALAGVLKPVVQAAIPQQMGAYVKRMCAAAEQRQG